MEGFRIRFIRGGRWGLRANFSVSSRTAFFCSSPLSWLGSARAPLTAPHDIDCTSGLGVTATDSAASRPPLINDWFAASLQQSPKISCKGCWPPRLLEVNEVYTVELTPGDKQLDTPPDCSDERGRLYVVRCRCCSELLRGLTLSRGLQFRAIPPLPRGSGWSTRST